MKLLIIDVNNEHSSDMERNYINALTTATEVYYYGPGYSTEDEFKMGLKAYISLLNGIDAIILTQQFFLASGRWGVRCAFSVNRHLLSNYSIFQALRYGERILNELEGVDILKIFLFFEDIATLPDRWKDELEVFVNKYFIITPGSAFVEKIDEGDFFGSPINNNYLDFTSRYVDRIISLTPIAISDNELFFSPLQERKYDWVVPGNINRGYPQRLHINHLLDQSEFSLYNDFHHNRDLQYRADADRINHCIYMDDDIKFVHKYIDSVYIDAHIPREIISQWREAYSLSIRSSRAAWADGGTTKTIVRKHVEIPARGAVLFSDNVFGFEKFGFKDGVNAILATEDDIIEKSRELFKNPRKMQEIAREGQKMVIEKHTFRKRAECTLEAIKRIQNNKFYGTYWENGEIIYI